MNMHILHADLLIRNVRDEDLNAVHEFASEEEICRYQAWGPNTLEDTRNYISASISETKNTPRQSYNLVVVLAATSEILGTCGIYLKGNNVAEIGFTLKKGAWGRGFGSKVALALIDYAFTRLHQDQIIATCDVLNEGSNALLKKVGFHQTRIIEKHMNIRGRARDTVFYELSK